MIIIGLLVLMVSVMVKQMIVRPATEALTVASNIAAGDLSQNVRVQTVDELGRLGLGLNSMISGLKGMIVKCQGCSSEDRGCLEKRQGNICRNLLMGVG